MSLCVDLVLNHTAREHPWARGWLAGDPEYADFYHAYPDRTMPDAYEATVNDVFPDQAPGSFTWVDEAQAWVWTSFFPYQWDLNWDNPRVFAAVLETILWLANRGIEIFRLDAVPFMGKRLGTSCMNQPEVHDIVQAMHALDQDRGARGGVQGGGDRRARRPRAPTSAATTATGPSASWPTTTS